MKNSPDHDPFNDLEKRLERYTEQPDSLVWENIDAALRPNRTVLWLPWVDHVALGVSVLLFTLLFISINANINHDNHQGSAQILRPLPKKNDSNFRGKVAVDRTDSAVVKNKNFKNRLRGGGVAAENRLAAIEKRDLKVSASKVVIKAVDETLLGSPSSSMDTLQEFISHSQKKNTADSLMMPLMDSLQRHSAASAVKDVKSNKRIPKRRRTIYASVSPALSFQRALPVGRDGVVVTAFSHRSILSAERLGLSFDLGVQGYIFKRFEYYGGVSVYHQRQTLRYTCQTNDTEVESSGDLDYTITPKTSVESMQYNMLNLGFQAGLLYHLSGKTLSHKFGSGLLYQRGFQNSVDDSYRNAGSTYFSYQLFYRNELRVSSHVKVFIQPSFSYSIAVSERLTAPFKLKPYRAGVGFGILYDF